MNEPLPDTIIYNCRNCNDPITQNAKYCSSCGQKNTDGRVSIGSFFSVFFSTIFNIESKFFQTMRHIFVPGKLTVEYFKGRHKRYFHPVRFFIVSALFLITAIGYQITDDIMFAHVHLTVEKQVLKQKFLTDVESATHYTLGQFSDSTALKPAFDTLYNQLAGKGIKDSVNLVQMINISNADEYDLRVSKNDLVNLSPKQIVDKYGIENGLERFMLQQKIKLIKDKGSFAPFVLGNFLWVILLLMPFLALILKIFYIGHDLFYVEHLVFSFHVHSFAFLLFAIVGFVILLGGPGWLIPIGFLLMFLYLYKALRNVYGQGGLMTFVKLWILNFIYLLLFAFFLMFGLLASMAAF